MDHLPPKVLLRIFAYCAPQHGYMHEAFAFSQVCTYWRCLALGDPSLWTNIDLDELELAMALLERSGGLPVSVRVSAEDPEWLELLPTRERISDLAVMQTGGWNVEKKLSRRLSGRFPLLENLHISIDEADSVGAATLQAPKLQQLSLHNFALRDWGPTVLGNLSHLSLKYDEIHSWPSKYDYKPMFTLSGLLATLQACPKLMYLNLCQLSDAKSVKSLTKTGSEENRAELPNLRELYLTDDAVVLTSLLSSLVLPACTAIGVVSSSDMTARIPRLPALLHHTISRLGWQSVHSASIGFGGLAIWVKVHVACPTGTNYDNFQLSIALTDVAFMDWASDAHNLRGYYKPLMDNLLQDVTVLYVSVKDEVDASVQDMRFPDFCAVVSALQSLRFLEVIGGANESSPAFLSALGSCLTAARTADNVWRPEIPFPSLQTLALRDFQLSSSNGLSFYDNSVAFRERRLLEGRAVEVVLVNCS